MSLSRRALLQALAGGAGLSVSGCLIPSKAAPRISHGARSAGVIPRRAFPGAGQLLVGAASIDLTPPEGSDVWLAGYGAQRKMRRIRDRIFGRCLYFDDGTRRVAIVVADVVGLLRPAIQRIRRLVGPEIELAVISTHNHQSPDTMGFWGPGVMYALPTKSGLDPAYIRVFERRLALAVKRASDGAQTAGLYFAEAQIPEGWTQNLRDPGLIDRTIQLVEARTSAGKPLASLVNFGCHPETLGDRAHLLTADFPGPLRKTIESRRGGTSVFANGILGGMITANVPSSASVRDRETFFVDMGNAIGAVCADALEAAKPYPVAGVDYARQTLELTTENELLTYVERVGLVEARARGRRQGFITEVGVISLGPAKWALVPGEPTPRVGMAIKKQLVAAGCEFPAVFGLANDELGYILQPDEFDDDRFSYERSVSVGRHAAPAMSQVIADLLAAD